MKQGQNFPVSSRLAVASVRLALAGMAGLLAACASPERSPVTREMVRAEIAQANAALARRVPAPVSDALLAEPAMASAVATPRAAPVPAEPRFDLIFNNANARDVFLALVADTPRSMTLHPDVGGTISMTLRRVTLREALEAIREVYGYDFRFEGSRIAVFPPAPQTRVFTLNYLDAQRTGSSELRVSSGGVGDVATPAGTAGALGALGAAGTAGTPLPGSPAGTTRYAARPSIQVATTTKSDLWSELAEAIRTIVGEKPGRHVLVTPQAGLIAVRAMPDELRQVESYLKSVRGAVERQVMLEAKIIDVELKDGFQSGVDWTKLFSDSSGRKLAIGPQGGATGGALTSDALGLRGLPTSTTNALTGALGLPNAGGGTFGLAIGTSKFEAVLGFLETFGDAQVLSSPRIATLNNQRALLKVGSDDYYITGVSGGTTTTTTTGVPQTTLPNLSLTPFFSGISLDVTPQIDEANNVILHVHPSVSTVQERNRDINLGTVGSFTLPLASSNVNATDTIVRVQDGAIVAIGGLMQAESNNAYAGLPGTADKGFFNQVLGNQKRSSRKRELVILIKPTVIHSAEDWASASRDSQARLEQLDSQLREQPVRVIQVPPAKTATP